MKIWDTVFIKREAMSKRQFKELLCAYFSQRHIKETIEEDQESFNVLIALGKSFINEALEICLYLCTIWKMTS